MITRDLPCTPVIDGKPSMVSFTGTDVGAFFIHRTHPDDLVDTVGMIGWTITHRPTGYAIARRIKTKAVAIHKARQLGALECWDFSDPDHAKSFSPELMEKIRVIREAP